VKILSADLLPKNPSHNLGLLSSVSGIHMLDTVVKCASGDTHSPSLVLSEAQKVNPATDGQWDPYPLKKGPDVVVIGHSNGKDLATVPTQELGNIST
jgi:hypothetical protein